MAEDHEIRLVIDNIVEDEMRGCVMCNSHVDLVYCQLESPLTGKPRSLLCFSCRQDALYNDEGFIDDTKLAELFRQVWEEEEDWDDEDDELDSI